MWVGRGLPQRRRVLALRERASAANRAVAHRAVGAEQLHPHGGVAQRSVDLLGVGNGRARAERRDEGRELVNLRLLELGLLGLACGPDACIGMRPVPTWKSTAAAPTPTREGANVDPSALRPWQVAQFAANSFSPPATCAPVKPSSARAGEDVRSAYATVISARSASTNTRGADL